MKLSFANAGWIVAAGLAALIAIVGFQDSTSKSGIVDLNKVVTTSRLGMQNRDKIQAAVNVRQDLLDFLGTYRVATTEQATRMRELWLKANPTEAEKQELESIKTAVQDSDRKRSELAQKETLTDADRDLLRDYANRIQSIQQSVLPRWNNEFDLEMQQLTNQLTTETVDAAKAALRNVAQQQGYTLVFESAMAPYAANDLTDAVLTSMNGS